MARPVKQGLDYFPFDTNFFSDVKIRKISRACGPNSISILICLLCNIYNDKGYYIVWDEDLPFVVADNVGTTEGAVIEVVKKAVQVNFFDKCMFEKYSILTSRGIQKRFKGAVSRREKIEYVENYLIPDDNNPISAYKNGISAYKSTQSKEKESKEDDITSQFPPISPPIGETPLREIKAYVLSCEQTWLDAIGMNRHLSPEKVGEWLDKFFAELEMNGETHKELKDFKKHFNNWLKIQLEHENSGNRKNTGNSKALREKDTFAQKDYSGGF